MQRELNLRYKALVLLAVVSLRFGTHGAAAGDLPRFIPNSGNTVYREPALIRNWPAGGLKELWRTEVGYGKSAVVEAGGLAFTAAEVDEKQWAVCLDPQSGSIRWKHLLYPKGNRHFVKGPVTSPVVDGERIYFIPYANYKGDVWEMRCPIICLKRDGTKVWSQDKSFWATEASTPLIVGDTLYVGADSPERVVLVALDKRSGKLLWAVKVKGSGRELAAPASLTYQVVGGVPQIIVATYGTREVLGVHARTGRILWRYPYPVPIRVGLVSTPVAYESHLFLCAGEGGRRNFSACLRMQAEQGTVNYKQLYLKHDLQTNMYNTPAVRHGAVFGFGGGSTKGFIHCSDLRTGKLLWKVEGKDWTQKQQLIIVEDMIFALTKNDELLMARAELSGFRELGRMRITAELGKQQQPTVANGRLYIRAKRWVICYSITAK